MTRRRVETLQGLQSDGTDTGNPEQLRRQAEQEAQNLRNFLNSLIDQSMNPMSITDENGTLIRFNRACGEMLGINPENLIGRYNLLEDTVVINQGRMPLVRSVFEEGKTVNFDLEYDAKDLKTISSDKSETVIMNVTVFPVRDSSGKIIRVVCQQVDITAHRQAEKAVADALEVNRAIVSNSPVGIIMYEASGQCVTANEAAARILGATVLQLKKQNFHEIQSWKRSGLYEPAMQALATGKATKILVELTTTFKKHLWLDVIFTPFRSGEELRMMAVFDDYTERKLAEGRLQASEGRYRSLVETAFDVIWEVDSEGRFTYISPRVEEFLGYTAEELTGRTIFEHMSDKEAERIREVFHEIIISRKPFPALESIIRHKDGRSVIIEAAGAPILGPNAELKGVRGTGRDITERKSLEEQLRQAQKMESIGRLAGGVAHDFNNILMIQMGYCEMMKNRLRSDDPLAEDLAQIEACVEKASSLTRQLLAFSRRQILQPVVYNLNELAIRLERMLGRLLGEDLILEMSLASSPAMVKTDPGQMEQVLVNLAVNARDAMPNGGKLTIEISTVELEQEYAGSHVGVSPGRYVMLAVSDTGSGMDEETMNHIFEPFYTTKGDSKGTGLGLSTVYGIVRQSGGSIWVYSEPGHGSTFKIYIPQIEERPAPCKGEEPGIVKGHGELILIVEDDQAIRVLTRQLVESLGYRAHSAANGGAAIIMIEEQGLRPDLVITDVVMPGMNGLVLIERLKKTMPDLRSIYMSGYTNGTVVQHAVMESGHGFLQKPFTTALLAAGIRAALEKHSTREHY